MNTNEARRAGNRKGGSSRSQAKIDASRENGKRGGRPRHVPTMAEVVHKAWTDVSKEQAKKDAAIAKAAERLAPKPPRPRVKKPKPLSCAVSAA